MWANMVLAYEKLPETIKTQIAGLRARHSIEATFGAAMVKRFLRGESGAGKRWKEYFLRVHPKLRPRIKGREYGEAQEMTARNAVGSTFRMRGSEYAPEIET